MFFKILFSTYQKFFTFFFNPQISECDFLVDYENGQSTSLEPIYSQDTNHWKIEMSLDFLDAPRSHKLFRAFYVPGTRGENGFCTFGQYVLLRNVKRQSK